MMLYDLVFVCNFGSLKNADKAYLNDFFQSTIRLLNIESPNNIKIVLGERSEFFLRELRIIEEMQCFYSDSQGNILEQSREALLSSTLPSLLVPISPLPNQERLNAFFAAYKTASVEAKSPECYSFREIYNENQFFFIGTKGKSKLRRFIREKKAFKFEDFHWSFPQNMAKQEQSQLGI